ncbi:hypothetical protein XACM_3243 [Xanthomonas euvesicatoria pv. citrumelo F1]|nr:hypothetical protein XACM_3243 [Xanthomonas euvesicatoria pv. citrumelo F1]
MGNLRVIDGGCLSGQGQYRNPRGAEILLFGIALNMLFSVFDYSLSG